MYLGREKGSLQVGEEGGSPPVPPRHTGLCPAPVFILSVGDGARGPSP